MRVHVPVAVLGLAAVVGAVGGQPAANTLRVLSYNIHHAEGTDGKLDVARIASVIRAAEPDLVAVQEVDRNTTRTNKVDQAAELARLTKLHGTFARAIDLQGGQYGQAILSRWPIKAVKVHPLPGKKGQEARIAVETTVEPGGGRPALTFVGTHFQHDDPATREEQAAKVNELFGSAGGPVILAGDLNAAPDSKPMKAIAEKWSFATAPDKGLLSIPAEKPRRQIDYVLYRPAGRFRVVQAKVIAEPVASDHRPVLAVLEWAGD
ncbi:MAG TPA: endonuclease/exonuclease/phosphatase family protein [Fimbriiglobus sp.]|nr:endonuclease/exonuclease/phosphatase family protein [Fimbriiglobus sp.]